MQRYVAIFCTYMSRTLTYGLQPTVFVGTQLITTKLKKKSKTMLFVKIILLKHHNNGKIQNCKGYIFEKK